MIVQVGGELVDVFSKCNNKNACFVVVPSSTTMEDCLLPGLVAVDCNYDTNGVGIGSPFGAEIKAFQSI